MRFLVVLSGPSIEFSPEDKPIVKECLIFRLEKTLELWQQLSLTSDDLFIITSGWDGDGSRYLPSSTVMKNYLVERGVPPYRIFEDPLAANTRQNAQNCCSLIADLSKKGVLQVKPYSTNFGDETAWPYKYVSPVQEVHVVTSQFHIARTRLLFELEIAKYPSISASLRYYAPAENGVFGSRLEAFLRAEFDAIRYVCFSEGLQLPSFSGEMLA